MKNKLKAVLIALAMLLGVAGVTIASTDVASASIDWCGSSGTSAMRPVHSGSATTAYITCGHSVQGVFLGDIAVDSVSLVSRAGGFISHTWCITTGGMSCNGFPPGGTVVYTAVKHGGVWSFSSSFTA